MIWMTIFKIKNALTSLAELRETETSHGNGDYVMGKTTYIEICSWGGFWM